MNKTQQDKPKTNKFIHILEHFQVNTRYTILK